MISNAECISRLERFLMETEAVEAYTIDHLDDFSEEELRETEKDREALLRAIRALEKAGEK